MRSNGWDTWFYSEMAKKFGKDYLMICVKPLLDIIEKNFAEFQIKNIDPFFLESHKLNITKLIDILFENLEKNVSSLNP